MNSANKCNCTAIEWIYSKLFLFFLQYYLILMTTMCKKNKKQKKTATVQSGN